MCIISSIHIITSSPYLPSFRFFDHRVQSTVKMATTQTETLTQPPIPIAVNNDLSPPQAKTNLKVVFGAMTLGEEGSAFSPLRHLTYQHY